MNRMAVYIIGMFIFLSQFYVFDSGSIQPSYALAAIVMLFTIPLIKLATQPAEVLKVYKLLIVFVLYTFFVNLFWSFKTSDVSFLVSSLYYAFNVALFICIYSVTGRSNVKIIFSATLLSILILVSIYLSGAGRYDFFPRFNAFFNDPNQMAFWALCLLAVCVINFDKFERPFFVDACVAMSTVIILASQSRSALIGLAFGFVSYGFKRITIVRRRVIALALAPVVLLCAWLSGLYVEGMNFEASQLTAVFERMQNTDVLAQSDTRGYLRLADYPEMLLMGAGQGLDERFMADGEIHSTWAGIMFYYGIVGLMLFLRPILFIFSRLSTIQKIAFLGPVAYSFTTFGARTPIFWVFLVFCFLASTKLRRASFAGAAGGIHANLESASRSSR